MTAESVEELKAKYNALKNQFDALGAVYDALKADVDYLKALGEWPTPEEFQEMRESDAQIEREIAEEMALFNKDGKGVM